MSNLYRVIDVLPVEGDTYAQNTVAIEIHSEDGVHPHERQEFSTTPAQAAKVALDKKRWRNSG